MTEVNHQKIVRRKMIKIDEDLCTGCGQCVVDCAEGAIEIIDGKAKVVTDAFCDGLGACMQGCPTGALTIEVREAAEFDEEAVEIHLEKLKQEETDSKEQIAADSCHQTSCSCPSANTIVYDAAWTETDVEGEIPSAIRQWPTKIELVSPNAPYFNNEELLVVSDCSPLVYGDFHRKILKGKPIVTICPILSLGDAELQKLEDILKANPIKKVNLILMEVPCCQKIRFYMGQIVKAVGRPIELWETIISRDGQIIREGKFEGLFEGL